MASTVDPRIAVASAERTSTGNSGKLVVGGKTHVMNRAFVNLLVDCTAASGTNPTLDLSIEWSTNGTDFAAGDTADTFVQITAAKKTVKQFSVKAPFYRVVWTIGGTTPSFTFSVSEYLTGSVG